MKKIMETSHAIAEAAKLCRPKVIAAYPITPQTHIVEKLSEIVANGELDAEYILVESEHSAMSACIGAEASGVRTFTATSSQGLALMHEVLFVASGMRLPIVMAVANRALSAPLNIWNDWSDSFASRDSGWIQLYCETAQEAFDTVIQTYKTAESSNVLLPAMVCVDGFFLSHVYEPADLLTQKQVDEFLPGYEHLIDPDNPITQGAWAGPDYYQEFKKQQHDAMTEAEKIIEKVNDEFFLTFKRCYGNGLIETYNMEKAKYAILTLGSVCGTIRHVLEKKGIKDVGLIKIKSLRPLPAKHIKKVCAPLDGIAVLEKDISPGLGGVLFSETKNYIDKPVIDFIGGLGGRDITEKHIEHIISRVRSGQTGLEWL